jgi:hypothetical protein
MPTKASPVAPPTTAKVDLPNLHKIITPDGDGWNGRQLDEIGIHLNVHDLKASVRELQDVIQILINRINNCKDC